MTHPTASHNPATQCPKWVAIDADYKDAVTDLLKLSFYLRQDGVPAVPAAIVSGRRTNSPVRSRLAATWQAPKKSKTHTESATETPEHSVDMAFVFIDGTKAPVTSAGDAFFPASNYEMWEPVTYTAAARSCSARPTGSRHCLSPKAKSIKLLRALTLFGKLLKEARFNLTKKVN